MRDGDLGVLPVGNRYFAMTDDGAGRVFGIRSNSGALADRRCTLSVGCTIEEVDLARRSVVERVSHSEPMVGLHSLVFQATPRRLILVVPDSVWTSMPATAFELRAVPLKP